MSDENWSPVGGCVAGGAHAEPQSLAELHSVIPKQFFNPSLPLAARTLLVTCLLATLSTALAIWAWEQGSWLWLALSWQLSGFALTSVFIVAHDCGHGAFLPSRRANFWLGQLMMLPTLYPFHAWRFSHNAHHARTNCFDEENYSLYADNAWLPMSIGQFRQRWAHARWWAAIYMLCRVVLPCGSAVHAIAIHYWPFWYRPQHRRQVLFSIALQLLFCAGLGWAIVTWSGSAWGLLHFWLAPWAVFQCWMAVYTFVHHTAEDIPLFSKETWNAVRGQFHGTANCRFPGWISFCHHFIDVHIPHHLSVNIPCYHLPSASRLLQESRFGGSVREFKFSWRYLLRQIAYCLLYDPVERSYRAWDALPKVAGARPSE